jgi:hypothetical protein
MRSRSYRVGLVSIGLLLALHAATAAYAARWIWHVEAAAAGPDARPG